MISGVEAKRVLDKVRPILPKTPEGIIPYQKSANVGRGGNGEVIETGEPRPLIRKSLRADWIFTTFGRFSYAPPDTRP